MTYGLLAASKEKLWCWRVKGGLKIEDLYIGWGFVSYRHPSERDLWHGSVKESKLPRHKKTVKTVEYDPRNSVPVTHCATNKEPVDSLNENKGGGHIQVICHSDYLKIKAYAANIAGEIGAELDLDFPLENASQEALDLINLSIDDEEHQEDGKDWTSKLGINLRYCVKLRKYSESSDEQLPLALSSIFSSSLHVSVVSNLRWLCRKSRTPAKPVGIILEKPQVSTVINRNAPAETSDTSPTKTIQVYQSRRKSPSAMTFRDLNISDQEANLHRSEEMIPFSENVGNLFTVPISIVGCCGISLNNKQKPYDYLKISESRGFHLPTNPEYASCNSSDSVLFEKNSDTIVSVPVTYQYQQHCHISDCNCLAMRNGLRSTGEFCIDYDSGSCKCSEYHSCQGLAESKASGLKPLTGAVAVNGSVSELHASVEQCCEYPLLLTTGEDKHVQDIDTAGQNVDVSTNFALLAKDHNEVSRLLNDSEMVIEVPMADKRSKGNIVVTDVATPFVDNHYPDVIMRDKRPTFPLNIKSYIRRRNKRKREIEQQTGAPECLEMEKKVEVQKKTGKSEVEARYGGFVRSPCEGLRPRKVKILPDQLELEVQNLYRITALA
ncbi:hypothetical protein HPP92_008438 [Vanilla planifolia]|uniref:Uncharacterized protein n=1 Tax=Vanilla planifolia TaxID=51239 RepID=A0A835V1Z1_VANPL|nr:hypothetical protein HPP92_008438 [Vanilla planifolia]